MSVVTEIERLQTAKETLKTKINAKNDSEHQITNELISEYGNFVDSISAGVDINEYYNLNVNSSNFNDMRLFIIKTPPFNIGTAVKNMSSLFYNYYWLETISPMDTSNVTNMANMFYSCSKLKSIPQLDTGNVANMASMFADCNALEIVPQLDASKADSIRYMFNQCQKLTNFGGLLNLGQAYLTSQSTNYNQYQLDLSTATSLTHDSLMNVINNLYDIATAGVQSQQLVLGTTNIAKLTAEEIAIATEKGWTVS